MALCPARARQARRRSSTSDAAPPPLMAFPGVAVDRRSPIASTGAFDAAIIMECSDLVAHGRRRARSRLRDQHRSPPRQRRATARSTGSTRRRRGLRRDGVRPRRRARRAADAGDRDAHLPRHPDRHRVVPLLEHHAAHVRHLPPAASRPASTRRAWRAASSTATTLGRLKLFGAVLSAMRARQTAGASRSCCVDHAMARASGGTYDDTEGLDQPSADGEGDPGGRVLQGDRARRLPRQHALEGRHRRRAPSPRHSAAAATRTPSGCTVDGSYADARRQLVTRLIEAMAPTTGRPARSTLVTASARGRSLPTARSSSTSPPGRRRTTSSPRVAARRRAAGRAHRHARSAGHRRPAAARRPRHAARAVPERTRQGLRGGRSVSAGPPTPAMPTGRPLGHRSDGRRRADARRRARAISRARSISSRRRTRRRSRTATRRTSSRARAIAAAGARRRCRHGARAGSDPARRPASRRCVWRARRDSTCAALAHDLGRRARHRRAPGGAAAAARAGASTLDQAIGLERALERDREAALAGASCRWRDMLPELPAVGSRSTTSNASGRGLDLPLGAAAGSRRLHAGGQPCAPARRRAARLRPSRVADARRRRRFCTRPLFWCNILILFD